MPEFNQIGTPQLASGMARLWGVDFPRVTSLAGEIQLTTSPWELPEFWALLGGALGWGTFSQASNAGNLGSAQLFNPAGSGVLLICDRLTISGSEGGVTRYNLGVTTTPATLTGSWANRDLRRRASSVNAVGGMAGQIREQNTAGVAFGTIYAITVRVAQSTTLDMRIDVVLPPGWGFMCQTAVANQDCIGSFIGRERPAPASELNLG